ncbi:MAG: hypothetical protein NTY61_04090, partial [Candidatus Parcubacteria bacterium]|nr:hypothetical protein [Candidatus Parcubacteria bacterium]
PPLFYFNITHSSKSMINRILANQINKMAQKDQLSREKVRKSGIWDNRVDHINTNALKDIINKYGWPTMSLVGKRSSRNAWLIAQHADHDIWFQKQCLIMLQEEYRKDPRNIDPANIAFLTDRICVTEKKAQIFGTQFYVNDKGILLLRPLKNKKDIDKRRKKYNLPPLRTYIKSAKDYTNSRKNV